MIAQLLVDGTDNIWALGDATATAYAPTAQAASQQGAYLGRIFNQMAQRDAAEDAMKAAEGGEGVAKLKKRYERLADLKSFQYTHQGSLAYIGSEKAIADLPFFNGNVSLVSFISLPVLTFLLCPRCLRHLLSYTPLPSSPMLIHTHRVVSGLCASCALFRFDRSRPEVLTGCSGDVRPGSVCRSAES